jgi:hypothetical protein
VVGGFDRLDDAVVDEALEKMLKQFGDRQVTDSGEMLHIFSLLMMLSSKGVIQKDVMDLAKECKAYIDDLLTADRLPPRELDSEWFERFEESAYGVQYWVTPDYAEEFGNVFKHLLAAREQSLRTLYPKMAVELLETLATSGTAFFELLCRSPTGDSRFASVPILSFIDPGQFVAEWLRSPKEEWRSVARALRERHKGASRNIELGPEKAWIETVLGLMAAEAKKLSGLARVRLERVAQMTLT